MEPRGNTQCGLQSLPTNSPRPSCFSYSFSLPVSTIATIAIAQASCRLVILFTRMGVAAGLTYHCFRRRAALDPFEMFLAVESVRRQTA
jgi:hypothetical protein